MANHKSAVKRHKQSIVRAARNRAHRTKFKNVVKAVNVAVQAKDKDLANLALIKATSILDRAATKGAIHWKRASRKISRLSRSVNSITAE